MNREEQREWEGAPCVPYSKPEQAFTAGEYLGLARAVETLRGLKAMHGLPGYLAAMATVEALAAQQRSNLAIKAMRHAARGGVDVATHIVAGMPDGVRYLPMDLVGMAEE